MGVAWYHGMVIIPESASTRRVTLGQGEGVAWYGNHPRECLDWLGLSEYRAYMMPRAIALAFPLAFPATFAL